MFNGILIRAYAQVESSDDSKLRNLGIDPCEHNFRSRTMDMRVLGSIRWAFQGWRAIVVQLDMHCEQSSRTEDRWRMAVSERGK